MFVGFDHQQIFKFSEFLATQNTHLLNTVPLMGFRCHICTQNTVLFWTGFGKVTKMIQLAPTQQPGGEAVLKQYFHEHHKLCPSLHNKSSQCSESIDIRPLSEQLSNCFNIIKPVHQRMLKVLVNQTCQTSCSGTLSLLSEPQLDLSGHHLYRRGAKRWK